MERIFSQRLRRARTMDGWEGGVTGEVGSLCGEAGSLCGKAGSLGRGFSCVSGEHVSSLSLRP